MNKFMMAIAVAVFAVSLKCSFSSARAQDSAKQGTTNAVADHSYGNFSLPNDPRAIALQDLFRRQDEMNAEASALAAAGRSAEAITLYKQSIDLNPLTAMMSHINPYSGVASILSSEGRYADAASEYDKLWRSNGAGGMNFEGNDELQLEYVLALHKAGRFTESFEVYKAAIMRNPSMLQGIACVPLAIAVTDVNYTTPQLETATHLALGVSYHLTGRHQEAVEQFQQAIRLKPGYAESYFFLAESLRFCPPKLQQSAGGREAAYRKALSLGNTLVRRRSQQELGVIPAITASEAAVLSKPINDRIREVEQARDKAARQPNL